MVVTSAAVKIQDLTDEKLQRERIELQAMTSTELISQIRSNIEILLSIKQNDKPVTLQSLESQTMEGFPNESHSVRSLLSNYNTETKNLNYDLVKKAKFVVPSVVDNTARQHATETHVKPNLGGVERPSTNRSDVSLNTV